MAQLSTPNTRWSSLAFVRLHSLFLCLKLHLHNLLWATHLPYSGTAFAEYRTEERAWWTRGMTSWLSNIEMQMEMCFTRKGGEGASSGGAVWRREGSFKGGGKTGSHLTLRSFHLIQG